MQYDAPVVVFVVWSSHAWTSVSQLSASTYAGPLTLRAGAGSPSP
jgi:hypothetical protein